MGQVFDGQKLADGLLEKLKEKAKGLRLEIVVFRTDEAGKVYSQLKKEAGEEVGIIVNINWFEVGEEEKVKQRIGEWNQDKIITGIMIQRPGLGWGREKGMEKDTFEAWWQDLVETIDGNKDVDGLRDDSLFVPATVLGVEKVLAYTKIDYGRGKKWYMVVVGSKGLVGRKLVQRLRKQVQNNIKIVGVDVGDDIKQEAKKADFLISATGQEGLIKSEMIKPGAVVIDVGWPKGDVDFEAVKNISSLITPVPGGVGPLTVVSLLENLVKAGYNQV